MRISLRIAACAAVLFYHSAVMAEPSPVNEPSLIQTPQARQLPAVKAQRKLVRERSSKHAPMNLTAFTSHPLLAVASRYIGHGNPTGTRGQWCRDFVNLVLVKAGHAPRDRSRRAIDALHLGRRVHDPRPGDLAVMRHHVTIVAGVSGGKVLGLGGNQGRRVKLSSFDTRRVIGYIRVL